MSTPTPPPEDRNPTAGLKAPWQRFVSHTLVNGYYIGGHELVYDTDFGMTVDQMPGLFLGIMLSGASTRIRLADTGEIDVPVGRPIIMNFDEKTACTNSYKAGEHCSGVVIMVPGDCLQDATESVIAFDTAFLSRLADRSTDIDVLPVSPAISRVAQQVLEVDPEQSGSALMLEGLALQMLGHFRNALDSSEAAAQGDLSRRDWERIKKVTAYLDSHIDTTPSLQALSRFAGVNQTTLSNTFKMAHGETIFAYLRNRRLDAARAILRTEDISITELSLRIGFSNPTSFSTAFRRRFGYPPSQEARQT